METHRIGIVMNGVTGRMGTNQHLMRSILAFIEQGGIRLNDNEYILPDPVLVGRNPVKLAQLAARSGLEKWTTNLDEAREIVGEAPIYVSFDIDSLDPAYAPGTGTPEAGGLTMREAQGMIRRLKGLDIRGADMVEVSPPFDVGGITALNGATVMYELLCVMAGDGK